MGWREAHKQYRKGSRLTAQSVEDLVARRVLRGLGCTAEQLYRLEAKLLDQQYGDDPLWDRTRRLLEAVWSQRSRASRLNAYHRVLGASWDVLEADGKHQDMLDRCELYQEAVKVPILFTRVKGTTVSLTYTVIEDALELTRWLAPFTVVGMVTRHGEPCLVVVQETELFIRQHGPYCLD